MTGRRGHGGAAFIDVVDRSGKLQVHAKRDVLGEDSFETLTNLDLGDLIGVDGRAFKSKRGELSLRAGEWQLLAKSLRAPPEKFHGLEDVETRYRHREIDLIANEEVRELFILRSKVVRAIRRWLDERGFLEVETPILQPLYGGALSRPFTTHHNALDRELYPAHRRRAVPQAADRRAASSACTRSARTSATRASRTSTTPSSRCSSGTRRTPTTWTSPRGSRS